MPVLEPALRDASARGHPVHACRVPVGAVAASASPTALAILVSAASGPPGNWRLALLEAGIFWLGDSGPKTTYLCRATGTGTTPTGTATPDIDNSFSGVDLKGYALLQAGPFATPPTLGEMLIGYIGGAGAGSRGNGYVWTFPEGFVSNPPGPGQGFGIALADAGNAQATGAEAYFVWEERST